MRRNTTVKHIVKRVLLCSLTAAVIFAFCPFSELKAFADENYGQLDPFTGEPYSTGGDGEKTAPVRKEVTNGVDYDYETGMYIFSVDGGDVEISCSVMDGMVTRDAVVIDYPNYSVVTIYKDGEVVDYYPGDELTETGEYSVMANQDNSNNTLFSFTIVNKVTGAISSYKMPNGFRVKDVMVDGEEGEWSRFIVPLEKEGYYQISYVCERTEVQYYLELTIDHTPPQIEFAGIDDDGKARGPVTFSGYEEGDTVVVMKDGERIKLAIPKLTSSGKYQIYVYDEAGNMTSKSFTLLIYVDTHGIIFFIVLASVIAAVVTFLILQRKSLKVR